METVLRSSDPEPSLNPMEALKVMRRRLEGAMDGDYVLFAGGDQFALFLAGKVFEEMGIEHLRLLRWDRRTDPQGNRTNHGYYTPVEYNTGGNTDVDIEGASPKR